MGEGALAFDGLVCFDWIDGIDGIDCELAFDEGAAWADLECSLPNADGDCRDSLFFFSFLISRFATLGFLGGIFKMTLRGTVAKMLKSPVS